VDPRAGPHTAMKRKIPASPGKRTLLSIPLPVTSLQQAWAIIFLGGTGGGDTLKQPRAGGKFRSSQFLPQVDILLCFIVYLTTLSVSQITKHRTIRPLLDNELK
jgi:hypothetical protein